METHQQPKCEHCGSHHLHVHKQGFNGVSAVLGFILALIVAALIIAALAPGESPLEAYVFAFLGVIGGTIGSNSIMWTCLSCGRKAYLKKKKAP